MEGEVKFDEGSRAVFGTQSGQNPTKAGFGKEGFIGPQSMTSRSLYQYNNARKFAWPIRVFFRLRLVKTEKQAQIFIIVLFFIALSIAVYIARDTLSTPEVRELPRVKINAV